MCRSVSDCATVLTTIAGRDPRDNFTLHQPSPVPDFTKALKTNALKGVRLGVPRLFVGTDANITKAFNESLDVMRSLGATIVDPADFPDATELRASGNSSIVLSADFKVDSSLFMFDVYMRANIPYRSA